MMAVAERAKLIAGRRARLAELEAAAGERRLGRDDLAALLDLRDWWRRHRNARRYCMPRLIEAAERRLVAAERRVAERRTNERYEAREKARARLARYRAEAAEIERG